MKKKKYMSKKIGNMIYIALGCILLTSCSNNQISLQYADGKYKNFGAMLDQCEGTTIVVWVGYNEANKEKARYEVVVTDGKGKSFHYAGGEHNLTRGDTVKWAREKISELNKDEEKNQIKPKQK